MIVQECVVTCPYCRSAKEELMPLRSVQAGYACGGCGRALTTPDGGCCVYCTYGSVICPPRQEMRDCCSG